MPTTEFTENNIFNHFRFPLFFRHFQICSNNHGMQCKHVQNDWNAKQIAHVNFNIALWVFFRGWIHKRHSSTLFLSSVVFLLRSFLSTNRNYWIKQSKMCVCMRLSVFFLSCHLLIFHFHSITFDIFRFSSLYQNVFTSTFPPPPQPLFFLLASLICWWRVCISPE